MAPTQKILRICVFVTLCLAINASSAQVRLPHLICDSMVLQRDAPIKIWGWASPGEKINIQFANKQYHTTTNNGGKWQLVLKPLPAGGPYDMQIDATNHLQINNVLIGDVWVCSGQSNMELPMERVKEKYPDEIANVNYPLIRMFNVPTHYNFNKKEDDVPPGCWRAATPQNILDFTAVGYFFAKTLFEKYHVPIGLIKNAVGGSPAEAWLSEDALKAFPEYATTLAQDKDSLFVDSIKKADNARSAAWYKTLDANDAGLHDAKPWFDTGYDASTGWQTMPVPGYWADYGLKGVNGAVWFRKEIDLPAEMAGKPAKLMLGRIVDADVVYINGVQSGNTTYQYPPRRYELPAGRLKTGKNIIVVRITNGGGRGGFVMDKPYTLTAGGQTINLTGHWQFKLGTTAQPQASTTFFQYKPQGLYNSLVATLLNYGIKGVIWYQGEANAYNPQAYAKLFPALIADWRKHWQQGNFPFLYVQLANFMETRQQPGESNWAALRDVQRRSLAVPNTGMAVIIDIGEWNDIHPLDKQDVGYRLALSAEKVAYGDKNVVASGPLYASAKTVGDSIVISFSNIGSGLLAKGGGGLKYFSIAGADKKFVWANAKIEGDKVVVWSDAVLLPVAVRYAWADNPEGANLYNVVGLPASPFTTEEK